MGHLINTKISSFLKISVNPGGLMITLVLWTSNLLIFGFVGN